MKPQGVRCTNIYIASIVTTSAKQQGIKSSEECHYVLEAEDHEAAHKQALELGNNANGIFVGIADLLMAYEGLEDGAEILWSAVELDESGGKGLVRAKAETRAFREGQSASGWYAARVVLREAYDDGSHEDASLYWINTYLLREPSRERAWARAMRVGKELENELGSHTCGSQRAHWVFMGIDDLIPLREPPAAGSLLWCDVVDAAIDNPGRLIPAKENLGVFEWARRQRMGDVPNK